MTVLQFVVVVIFSMFLVSFVALRGIPFKRKKENSSAKAFSYAALGGNVIIGMTVLALFLSPDKAIAQIANVHIFSSKELLSTGLGYIGAGLATGLASVGAGWGTGIVGSTSIKVGNINPKMLGKSMIYAGLANGVATYGLIVSILIMSKI
ncbi:ATP synthase subunit C [Mesoaciditoga lauensis]|uniref:ATP synthase subunit C n=1 Tax=Mesoaciditoga lauensis TaxID=1495039 RepID=UPI00068B80B8|nr:ATP synthase subunit C [Mesoaciditoga lauensis]